MNTSSAHPLKLWLKDIRDIAKSFINSLMTMTIKDFKNLPSLYLAWLVKQWTENTLHVVIETGLLGFLIWLIFFKKTASDKGPSKKFSAEAQQERLSDYKNKREPLALPLQSHHMRLLNNFVTIESLAVDKDRNNEKTGKYYNIRLTNRDGAIVKVENVLNMASFDFFGMARNKDVLRVAKENLEKYGCGSCGPRGFYGTIDAHLKYEEEIAAFVNDRVKDKDYPYEAIAYSDGASSITSAIPAFSKKGDLLIVDEACNESIFAGIKLSKSDVKRFKHNDMADLRQILGLIRDDDRLKKRDSTQQRRFIIVEGIYRNTGQICNLLELKKIKDEFKYRVILDESLSFGTLGAKGKGITEEFDIPLDEIEIINIAMDTAIGSIGGVCIGSREIVDHQRLSGAGYCFSASAPPFLSSVACKSLEFIKENKDKMLEKLKENAAYLTSALKSVVVATKKVNSGCELVHISENSTVKCKTHSPVQFLALKVPKDVSKASAVEILTDMEARCIMNKLGVSSGKYAFAGIPNPNLELGLRFSVTSLMSKADIDGIVSIVESAFKLATSPSKSK